MNISDAARLVGAKESEVLDVHDHDHGVVIETVGSLPMILVDDATPDGEGKSGLMLLEAADQAPWGFPVFTPVDDEEPAAADEDGDEPAKTTAPAKKAASSTKKAARGKPAAADEDGDDA